MGFRNLPPLTLATLLWLPSMLLAAGRPNFVYILADDLGYGDVHCLNPQRGKIKTPHLDRLAAQGMVFTDAHSGSSVCSPTRYGVLTGRYSWRTRLQQGVLKGFDPPLIASDRLTVARLLQQHGYTTACIGKWHLGMAIPRNQPSPKISDGPTTRGFDYYFGISASSDMPPYAFIENDRFTEPLTAEKEWGRKGPAAAGFEVLDTLPTLARRSVEWIGKQTRTKRPFFLYLALNAPHRPILPTKEWQGRSGLSDFGDYVMETDWAVGEVLAALDQAGLAKNTLVIFTSDNGVAPAAKPAELQKQGHFSSADRRGIKNDIWDGGHRIPFIVRWPGHVKRGTRSDQITCLTDFMATCADLLEAELPATAAEDSVSMLPGLLGKAHRPLREAIVHHSGDGKFAIRQGRWKLEFCAGSGGWSKPQDEEASQQGLPNIQLYNLADDVGEKQNVEASHPETIKSLTALLERYVANGRSTPGRKQENDMPVNF